MSHLTFESSEITDIYEVDSLKVAKTTRDPAAEITQMRVEIVPLEDGKYLVDTYVFGYPLTAKGSRSLRRGRTTILGQSDAQDRYDLVREAVLASLTRHGIDVDVVESTHATYTWQQWRARRQEYLLGMAKRSGIEA